MRRAVPLRSFGKSAALAIALAVPASLPLAVMPAPALAQSADPLAQLRADNTAEEDRSFLTAFLEDKLSGAGRSVRITGFSGSLSSRASLDTLTIADDTGVWLRLEGVTLDWNRAAILRGRVEITALKADLIDMSRAPAAPQTAAPAPEATPFSLPDLPVSVRIDEIEAKRIALGAPLLGQAVSFSLKGSTSLAEGAGAIKLALIREDKGPKGRFALEASYDNADKRLALDLLAEEEAGGLAATLAGLPGAPELKLTVAGAGPLDDFTADIGLASDGAPRLAGQVILSTVPPEAASGAAEADRGGAPPAALRRVDAKLGGDIAALFVPDYRPFFGENIALTVSGGERADGGLQLDQLTLISQALTLSGSAALDAGRWPEKFTLTASIKEASGAPVLLPVSGPKTRVKAAQMDLSFDRAAGEEWQGSLAIDALEQPDLAARRLALSASGYIRERRPGNLGSAFALLNYAAEGLAPKNPALARALGADILGGARITFVKREPLLIEDLTLSGADYGLSGDVSVIGDMSAIDIKTDLDLTAADLSRFAALSGQNLLGAAQVAIKGALEPLSGAFDMTIEGQTDNLAIGQADADRLLRGRGTLSVAAKRDGTGLHLTALNAETRAVTVTASGDLNSTRTALAGRVRLADVAPYVEGLSGPLSVTGEVARSGEGPWQLALDADGPSGTSAAARGSVAASFDSANIDISGAGPLALANPFLRPRSVSGTVNLDLSLNGPLAVSSLSGQITTRGARLSAPALRTALSNLDATATLGGGQARIDASGAVSSGGRLRLSGPVDLDAPYQGDLAVVLEAIVLQDPQLYTSTVSGTVKVKGPLAGGALISGALELGETDLRVPDSGVGSTGELLDVVHLGEPSAARASRARAGLLSDGAGGSASGATGGGAAYPLDLRIGATRRIFLRGRGIDAELGGVLRLAGTTANIQPSGRFDLVRGRLDILGKRFSLDEGYAQLIGNFTPYIRLVASTSASDTQISIVIEGDAAQPQISFLSSPELPQDEVLARLLFGRAISEISPVQAAQLAAAVATLAGKGGTGVIGKLRDNFGLDDLDVTTSEDGEASLRAGRYISDNVYTDVTVGSSGTSEINLNLDVSPNLTVKGGLSSDGNTGIGIYFEKDY
ncbi:MAG: translocation/assembly module TamB domain-containing protein [Paracoccaceae bacterium]